MITGNNKHPNAELLLIVTVGAMQPRAVAVTKITMPTMPSKKNARQAMPMIMPMQSFW